MYSVRKCSELILLLGAVQFSQHHLLIPKVLFIKGKTDKFDVLKMSNFCNTKDSAKMTKKISYEAEEYF